MLKKDSGNNLMAFPFSFKSPSIVREPKLPLFIARVRPSGIERIIRQQVNVPLRDLAQFCALPILGSHNVGLVGRFQPWCPSLDLAGSLDSWRRRSQPKCLLNIAKDGFLGLRERMDCVRSTSELFVVPFLASSFAEGDRVNHHKACCTETK